MLSALDGAGLVPVPVLVAVLLLRTVLLFALAGVIRLIAPDWWPHSLIMTNALILIVDLATIGVVIMMVRRRGIGFGALVGRFRPADARWSLLMLAVLAVGFLAASVIGNLIAYGGAPAVAGQLSVPLWVGLGALPAALTIGLAEEVLYRGIALDQLTRRVGWVGALLITAVFFALQHIPLALISGPAVLAKVIMTFLVGLLLAGLMLRLRRLWPLVLSHAVIDLIFLGLPTLLAAL